MSDTLFPLDDYTVSHTQEINSDIEGYAPTWRKTRQFTASDRASESDQPDKSPGKLFTPGVSSEGVSPYGDRSTHEHKFTPVWQSDCTLVNWCNCGEKRDCDTKELRESLKGCIDVRTEYRGETDKSSNNAIQEFARAVAVKDRQIAWVKCQLLERTHDLHSRIETPSYLALDEIRRDGGTQPRAAIDLKHVKLLEEQMEDGKELEPVTVFYDGESYWLADGYHRWQAHSHRGKEALACVIHQGSRRDTVLYSVGANADHKPALPRSREDKRRAVLTLLQDPEWREWSNYKIAEACRVNEKTVRNIRLSLTTDIRSEVSTRTYKTKQGTVAKMKTSNIGGKFPTSIKQKQDSNRRTERGDHPLNSCQSATITQLPSQILQAWNSIQENET